MVGLNKIMIIGNVGTDPEMRYTAAGNPVTSFRIATSRSYNTGAGERKQETEWFSVVTWNQLAEQVNQYLSKGRRAYVEGRLHTNTWQGQDGVTRSRNEIIADKVLFLDRQPQDGGSGGAGGSAESEGAESGAPGGAMEPEDLPF